MNIGRLQKSLHIWYIIQMENSKIFILCNLWTINTAITRLNYFHYFATDVKLSYSKNLALDNIQQCEKVSDHKWNTFNKPLAFMSGIPLTNFWFQVYGWSKATPSCFFLPFLQGRQLL